MTVDEYFDWRKKDEQDGMARQICDQADEIRRLKAEIVRLNWRLHKHGGVLSEKSVSTSV